MKNRISLRLIKHLNELRKRALKEKDEDKRRDYWWLYHDAKTIEPEIREMILKSENQTLLEMMSNALTEGERIEIRGFGSFSLHVRPPRLGRNPKTGDSVALPGKYVPHFKPGKELRDRVHAGEANGGG